MNKKSLTLVLLLAALLGSGNIANAVDAPDVNLSQQPTGQNSPFGAFKLLQCDGPAKLNHISTHQVKDIRGVWVPEKVDPVTRLPSKNANAVDWTPDPKFVACDFRGLMIQAQFLINAAIVVGVLAAIIGFAYAGFLYITGAEKNISKAKEIFPKIFWGFIIMLTAWFIVFQILKWLTPDGSAYLQ